MDYQNFSTPKLRDWFKGFAERECKQVSPFYHAISNQIAEDDELLRMAAFSKRRQPMPNLFLASVHYLLLTGQRSHELAGYYPSITKGCKRDLPFGLFKAFCMDNREEIIALEQTRMVQTNALNRCAYIMPILSGLFGDQDISVVDIGTSAGLTLNFDRYEYHYNGGHLVGGSPVKIRSDIREGALPAFDKIVRVRRKTGVDQNPLDLTVETNANWLRALVWADMTERLERMEQAIRIARQEKIRFEAASRLEDFEAVIEGRECGLPLVVYHTHALYQFAPEEGEGFRRLLDKIGKGRDLTYLAAEGSGVFGKDYGLNGVVVELTEYKNGVKGSRLVAETDGHANWIKWKR